MGPVPVYDWASQPGYSHLQQPQPLQEGPNHSLLHGLGGKYPEAGRVDSSSQVSSNRNGGSGRLDMKTGGLLSDSYMPTHNHSTQPNISTESGGYRIPTYSNKSIQPRSPKDRSAPSDADLIRGIDRLSINSPRHSGSHSDPDSPQNKSLTITDDGHFILGPQWTVPEPEVAQDIAGCNTERVVVKSIQYSPEHQSHFTLTETIDDCDLTVSGGLSVGVVDPPELSEPKKDCSLFSCWGRPESPDYTDLELLPVKPNSNGKPTPRDGADHRSIAEILTSTPSGSHERALEIDHLAHLNAYGTSDNHTNGHAHHSNDDHDHYPDQAQPPRALRRMKRFLKGKSRRDLEF